MTPTVDVSEHIASAIPDAQLVVLQDCGHFTFLECGSEVRRHIDAFRALAKR